MDSIEYLWFLMLFMSGTNRVTEAAKLVLLSRCCSGDVPVVSLYKVNMERATILWLKGKKTQPPRDDCVFFKHFESS